MTTPDPQHPIQIVIGAKNALREAADAWAARLDLTHCVLDVTLPGFNPVLVLRNPNGASPKDGSSHELPPDADPDAFARDLLRQLREDVDPPGPIRTDAILDRALDLYVIDRARLRTDCWGRMSSPAARTPENGAYRTVRALEGLPSAHLRREGGIVRLTKMRIAPGVEYERATIAMATIRHRLHLHDTILPSTIAGAILEMTMDQVVGHPVMGPWIPLSVRDNGEVTTIEFDMPLQGTLPDIGPDDLRQTEEGRRR